MGRARKDPLSEEAEALSREWDRKISEVRKKKEAALKKLAEKQYKEQIKTAERILSALYEACGVTVKNEEADRFAGYIMEHAKEIREVICPDETSDYVVTGEDDNAEDEPFV